MPWCSVGGRAVEFSAEQFWSRVERTDGCWFWTGNYSGGGYGQLSVRVPGLGSSAKPVTLRSTRMAWELLVGPLHADDELDHLCRNRSCVNPAHLEPVTPGVNKQRAVKHRQAEQRQREHRPAGPHVEWANEVNAILEEFELSQRELATLLDSNDATISLWVNGHRSPRSTSRRRVNALVEALRQRREVAA